MPFSDRVSRMSAPHMEIAIAAAACASASVSQGWPVASWSSARFGVTMAAPRYADRFRRLGSTMTRTPASAAAAKTARSTPSDTTPLP